MRTRRVSHLPVAKGTKQWTPRLQSIVPPFLTSGPHSDPAGGYCLETYIPEDAQLHGLLYAF